MEAYSVVQQPQLEILEVYLAALHQVQVVVVCLVPLAVASNQRNSLSVTKLAQHYTTIQ